MGRDRYGLLVGALAITVIGLFFLVARPPARRHTKTQSEGITHLVPATSTPRIENRISITIEGGFRVIRSNGVPDHETGNFPNSGNPHRMAAQDYVYKIPAKPKQARSITPLGMRNFGIAVNGIPFDPGAAEWYLGHRHGPWQYEALSGAVALGIDTNHGHVQLSGAYHYHGLPDELLAAVKLSPRKHSSLIGWAADGYPIYAIYGFAQAEDASSKIRALQSSYRLKRGSRPAGPREPGGHYDGTFVADYEYVTGLGDLDECNGRFGITPDFPQGTYAYFLTSGWPVIPRCFRGTPSRSFRDRRLGPRRPAH